MRDPDVDFLEGDIVTPCDYTASQYKFTLGKHYVVQRRTDLPCTIVYTDVPGGGSFGRDWIYACRPVSGFFKLVTEPAKATRKGFR
jgi:hypothetical protein